MDDATLMYAALLALTMQNVTQVGVDNPDFPTTELPSYDMYYFVKPMVFFVAQSDIVEVS